MNDADLIKILGSAGGVLGTIVILARAGLLKITVGNGNTYSQAQMDRAEEDSKWRGEVTEKLKVIHEKVDEFADRLDRHLNDEEEKIDKVDARLTVIESKLR